MWKIPFVSTGILAIALAFTSSIGADLFARPIEAEIETMTRTALGSPVETVQAAEIEKLPDPVKRYLNYAGVRPGTLKTRLAYLPQVGGIRSEPGQDWNYLVIDQYLSPRPVANIWYTHANFFVPIPSQGRDYYLEGQGGMYFKMFGLLPVMDGKGPDYALGFLQEYVGLMPFSPTSFLAENIRWESIDANSAIITLSDHGFTATGTFRFNELGEVTEFSLPGRSRSTNAGSVVTPWSTYSRNYKEINGFKIPTEGEAVWHLPEGDFTYVWTKIKDARYQ